MRVGIEAGNAGERVTGEFALKFAQDGGGVRRARAVQTLIDELPNAGERNNLGSYQRDAVARCTETPTPEQYADVLRYNDFSQIKQSKQVARVMVDDTSDPGMITQLEGFVPQDWQVGHHWPPVYIQKRFQEMGVQISNVDDVPVQVCVEFAHGKGGSASSIHNLMRNGPFPKTAGGLDQYQTPQELMARLLQFVKESPDDEVKPFAKALRGWAREHNIPFSQ